MEYAFNCLVQSNFTNPSMKHLRNSSRPNLYSGKTRPTIYSLVQSNLQPYFYDEPVQTGPVCDQFQEASNINLQNYYEKPHYYPPVQPVNQQPPLHYYTSSLQEALYSQTYSNIENIVFENTKMIEQLKRENQRLKIHLSNIKTLFQFKLKNKKIQVGHEQQKPLNYKKMAERFIQKFPAKKQHFQNTDMSSQQVEKQNKKSKNYKTVVNNLIKEQKQKTQVQMKKQAQRNLPLPYKGSVNYTDQKWIIEQNFVMGFLHLWLKNQVQWTSDRQCTIEKRQIMDKYLKWKEKQNFQISNNLEHFKIQQIVTNQIKAMFNCSCTQKEYAGLVFVKGGDTKSQYTALIKQEEKIDDLIQAEK